jgi:hypothetical protein
MAATGYRLATRDRLAKPAKCHRRRRMEADRRIRLHLLAGIGRARTMSSRIALCLNASFRCFTDSRGRTRPKDRGEVIHQHGMKRPRVPHRAQVLDKMQMNSNADLTPTSPLRVFLVEDSAVIRERLAETISSLENVEVVGHAGAEAATILFDKSREYDLFCGTPEKLVLRRAAPSIGARVGAGFGKESRNREVP